MSKTMIATSATFQSSGLTSKTQSRKESINQKPDYKKDLNYNEMPVYPAK